MPDQGSKTAGTAGLAWQGIFPVNGPELVETLVRVRIRVTGRT